jgi:hypothetical protein
VARIHSYLREFNPAAAANVAGALIEAGNKAAAANKCVSTPPKFPVKQRLRAWSTPQNEAVIVGQASVGCNALHGFFLVFGNLKIQKRRGMFACS